MGFSEKLKALRGQQGLKQSDLAQASGLSTNKIQRYEQSNQKPKGADVLALARALGVTADYLLDDSLPFPPAEEHLSEKVAIIRKLEGLVGALLSGPDDTGIGPPDLPDVVRLPVLKLGAGFEVTFDAAGQPAGEDAGEMYFDALGEGTYFAAELYGSGMQGSGESGFAPGEILVFRVAAAAEVASGDYVYVRTAEHGLFRQIFVDGDRLRLRAQNPADPEVAVSAEEVERVCRLVRRIKRY